MLVEIDALAGRRTDHGVCELAQRPAVRQRLLEHVGLLTARTGAELFAHRPAVAQEPVVIDAGALATPARLVRRRARALYFLGVLEEHMAVAVVEPIRLVVDEQATTV